MSAVHVLKMLGSGLEKHNFPVKASLGILQIIGETIDGLTADLWQEQGVIEVAEAEVNGQPRVLAAGVVEMTSQSSARGQQTQPLLLTESEAVNNLN